MGFLDKAKQAANDLAAKADTALAGSGMGGSGLSAGPSPERCFRDLGVLAYLEATGRQADPAERERLLGALREAESRGPLNLHLQTAAPAPGTVPPPPGAAAQGAPPPPPGAAATPPPPSPGAVMPAPPASAPVPEAPVQPTAPPPPPPSWAAGDQG
ncbi:hypothetical protein [Nocardioides caldifontis]|uniref:hypothetical protein n=1 Tax=Nocardioides caldifontis TaxID=2588938 RepID=UPI0011E067EC|nr:hypothetical protein [Nocardioides caldifontis]